MALQRIVNVRNLKSEVYRIVRLGITSRSLPPGAYLHESELAAELGVSRTPVREALHRLAQEGMVDLQPRRGAFVKKWTPQEIYEILVMREVLEGLAARLAARHLSDAEIDALEDCHADYRRGLIDYSQADERFHQAIIDASRNARLTKVVLNLADTLQMIDLRARIFATPGRIEASLKEHREVIAALRARDERLAEGAARAHFKYAQSICWELATAD